MEPFDEGYAAWHADKDLFDNPCADKVDADEWEAGWLEASRDNSQFGAGA